jgi:hypothetical protein
MSYGTNNALALVHFLVDVERVWDSRSEVLCWDADMMIKLPWDFVQARTWAAKEQTNSSVKMHKDFKKEPKQLKCEEGQVSDL